MAQFELKKFVFRVYFCSGRGHLTNCLGGYRYVFWRDLPPPAASQPPRLIAPMQLIRNVPTKKPFILLWRTVFCKMLRRHSPFSNNYFCCGWRRDSGRRVYTIHWNRGNEIALTSPVGHRCAVETTVTATALSMFHDAIDGRPPSFCYQLSRTTIHISRAWISINDWRLSLLNVVCPCSVRRRQYIIIAQYCSYRKIFVYFCLPKPVSTISLIEAKHARLTIFLLSTRSDRCTGRNHYKKFDRPLGNALYAMATKNKNNKWSLDFTR